MSKNIENKTPSRTEDQLIESVKKLVDVEQCQLFSERAAERGLSRLEAACQARILEIKPHSTKQKVPKRHIEMKTHRAAELALQELINDYKANLPPTTYNELAQRCGYQPNRWFGQVTDMIDAACALNNIPSFALVRVRESNGQINEDAWKNIKYNHFRDKIIERAMTSVWSDADFLKIRDAIGVFISMGFGNKKAWEYVFTQINFERWIAG